MRRGEEDGEEAPSTIQQMCVQSCGRRLGFAVFKRRFSSVYQIVPLLLLRSLSMDFGLQQQHDYSDQCYILEQIEEFIEFNGILISLGHLGMR
mmetsp:Transcript_30667/g.73563  ORF Transcript_30667/g.73563 Transcript_30667/m.73563 type:complete len:93 (-) Transcript_30667:43-321(-)